MGCAGEIPSAMGYGGMGAWYRTLKIQRTRGGAERHRTEGEAVNRRNGIVESATVERRRLWGCRMPRSCPTAQSIRIVQVVSLHSRNRPGRSSQSSSFRGLVHVAIIVWGGQPGVEDRS